MRAARFWALSRNARRARRSLSAWRFRSFLARTPSDSEALQADRARRATQIPLHVNGAAPNTAEEEQREGHG